MKERKILHSISGVIKEDKVTAKQLEASIANGGSTFLDGKDMIGTENFSVSIFPERNTKVKTLTEDEIAKFKETHKDLLDSNKNVLGVGTWFDDEVNTWVIDVVVIIPHSLEQKAKDLGNKYNQKYIYDLKTSNVIPTGGTDTMVYGPKSEADRILDVLAAIKGDVLNNKLMKERKRLQYIAGILKEDRSTAKQLAKEFGDEQYINWSTVKYEEFDDGAWGLAFEMNIPKTSFGETKDDADKYFQAEYGRNSYVGAGQSYSKAFTSTKDGGNVWIVSLFAKGGYDV